MLKKFFIVFTCLFLALSPIKSNASSYQEEEPFKDSRFSIVNDSDSVVYNFDYWVLAVSPYNYNDTSTFNVFLYLIADSSESLGTSKGVLRFYTDTYPYNTKLNSLYTGGIGSPTDYEQSIYIFGNRPITSSNLNISFNYSGSRRTFPTSYIGGWCFDNYNLDKFPTYQGASSNYTSTVILASNVDMYDQYGNLLQYGNYYTLLQYFGGTLDASKIKDWSGHETAPGVVVEPTTSGGTSGDSQTSKDQLETSKGIWGTVKEIFKVISNLPDIIASALEHPLQLLLDGIISGLKELFIPKENPFQPLLDLLHEKFGLIFQIFDLVNLTLDSSLFTDSPPDLSFTFSGSESHLISSLNGFKFELIDWSVVEPYRNFIRNLIAGITWFFFIRRIKKQAHRVINGESFGGD